MILTAASDPMTSTIVSPAAGWGNLAGEGTPRRPQHPALKLHGLTPTDPLVPVNERSSLTWS